MRTIQGKLLTALAMLSLGLMFVGGSGFYASKTASDGLRTVYLNRVKPLTDLKTVADMYAVNIVDTSHKVRNGGMTWEAGNASLIQASSEISKSWKNYAQGVTHPEEASLVATANAQMAVGDKASDELREILQARNQAALDAFVKDKLYPVIDPISETISKLVTLQVTSAGVTHDQTDTRIATATWIGLASVLSAVGGVVFTLWTIMNGVVHPLSNITGCMNRLARGELGLAIPYTDRGDEIGTMATSVQVFKDNAELMHRMRGEQEAADLRLAEQRKLEMRDLAERFQRTVGGIVRTVSETAKQLEYATNSLSKTAEATQVQSGTAATASEQTSANVQSVAAAAEQLASTVTEIGRQVQHSSQIAGQAVNQASHTNNRVKELSNSASRIGDVITMINSIAAQTNLLALNATIEAARAGDVGKGFAVVAQEVKQLASQTAQATNEISSQIADMQSATKDAVVAIKDITDTINQMSEICGAIAAAVEQQGATTREISRNATEAARGTTEVAHSITDVSRGASETGFALGDLMTSAKRLSTESGSLQSEVQTFLKTVRAA